jgi:excisionase family DNA binding protein
VKRKSIKIAELAEMLNLPHQQVRRLAIAGKIPETIKSRGGHYRFRNTACFTRWVATEKGRLYRRDILGNAKAEPGEREARAEQIAPPLFDFMRWLKTHPVTHETPTQAIRFLRKQLEPLVKFVASLDLEIDDRGLSLPGKWDTNARDGL